MADAVILAEPRLDQPVLANPTTLQLVTTAGQVRRRVLIAAPLSCVALFGSYLLYPAESGLRPLLVAGMVGLVVIGYLVVVPPLPDREFLAQVPWRQVSARVVGAFRIEVDDPLVPAVRSLAMPGPHRGVVARTGRVWLAGPDRRGRGRGACGGVSGRTSGSPGRRWATTGRGSP
ncbi:hypothetical protein [Actinokineospora sp. HUAS TT18]|uniref:hypothetical protein n=1 Tax=Actinokineospora sp. HUAS TT18 TaxID=3447451 RepID=UPI003F51F347